MAGEAPKVDIATDVYFYDDDPDKFPDECIDDTCIRVDVYRNDEGNNPLPIWFGQLVGLVDQGVRATAIARAAFGNATDCLKPWAIVDRWDEHWEDGMPAALPWTPGTRSNFDNYKKDGDVDPAITTPDVYEPATVEYEDTDGDGEGDSPLWGTYQAGTGFHPFEFNPRRHRSVTTPTTTACRCPSSRATLVTGISAPAGSCGSISARSSTTTWNTNTSPPANAGADCYRWIIKNCVGTTVKIGDEIDVRQSHRARRRVRRGRASKRMVLATATGPSLINQDPTAKWDPMGGAQRRGCRRG